MASKGLRTGPGQSVVVGTQCARRPTVIVAVPLAFGAAVYVKLPLGAIAGPALNNAGFVLPVISNTSDWSASFGGPEWMP